MSPKEKVNEEEWNAGSDEKTTDEGVDSAKIDNTDDSCEETIDESIDDESSIAHCSEVGINDDSAHIDVKP